MSCLQEKKNASGHRTTAMTFCSLEVGQLERPGGTIAAVTMPWDGVSWGHHHRLRQPFCL